MQFVFQAKQCGLVGVKVFVCGLFIVVVGVDGFALLCENLEFGEHLRVAAIGVAGLTLGSQRKGRFGWA